MLSVNIIVTRSSQREDFIPCPVFETRSRNVSLLLNPDCIPYFLLLACYFQQQLLIEVIFLHCHAFSPRFLFLDLSQNCVLNFFPFLFEQVLLLLLFGNISFYFLLEDLREVVVDLFRELLLHVLLLYLILKLLSVL